MEAEFVDLVHDVRELYDIVLSEALHYSQLEVEGNATGFIGDFTLLVDRVAALFAFNASVVAHFDDLCGGKVGG